jgi:glucose/arabinose dehydrogenase
VAGLVAACGGNGAGGDPVVQDPRLQAGRVVFDAQCLACHADATTGAVATTGTSLVKARDRPDVIAAAIAANVGGMRQFSGLTATDLSNIAAYLGAAIPAPTASAPAPAPSPATAPVPAPAPPPVAGLTPAPDSGVPGSGRFSGSDAVNTTARTQQMASGLQAPWGAALLPDGRLLVTQRLAGTFAIVDLAGGRIDATVSTGLAVAGTSGQGGLLDVVLDPSFASNQRIFWSFVEAGAGGVGTAVARGRLVGTALQDVQVIWRQVPKRSTGQHFGSRLAFRSDGTLFVTTGDQGWDSPDSPGTGNAQSIATTTGKVVRITVDGAPAPGNPVLGTGGLREIWSLGHRNVQSAAIHPTTGELWVGEHGAQGGDEINVARAAGNHGWPFVGYGCDYGDPVGTACAIGGGVHAPRYVEPLTSWGPTSIAPAGMTFDAVGTRYPGWSGHLFVGALAGQGVWRLTVSGNAITGRELMLRSAGERFRDAVQAPDGWIYLLTDSGRVLRLLPS